MQLGHCLKKSRHRRQPLPRKLRPRFLRIELLQTPPQHLPRRINLPPLPLLNHQPEHLPHIFRRLIMFPPVAQHMHRPHNPPPLQLPDRRRHIRPCHTQRLRNLLRRQCPRRQIQQRMDLRHRPVNPPPRPHLTPMQDVSLLHPSQTSHISTFSSIRIYRTQSCHVNPRVRQFPGHSCSKKSRHPEPGLLSSRTRLVIPNEDSCRPEPGLSSRTKIPVVPNQACLPERRFLSSRTRLVIPNEVRDLGFAGATTAPTLAFGGGAARKRCDKSQQRTAASAAGVLLGTRYWALDTSYWLLATRRSA